LNNIIYVNNMFITVGASGTILTSNQTAIIISLA
jgi:energy-converting hydrogenase Eha subunit C